MGAQWENSGNSLGKAGIAPFCGAEEGFHLLPGFMGIVHLGSFGSTFLCRVKYGPYGILLPAAWRLQCGVNSENRQR
jgi:hypothetical protein